MVRGLNAVQIGRLARQADRLAGSLSQEPMLRSNSSGALAISPMPAEKTVTVDSSREKELVSMMQEQREQVWLGHLVTHKTSPACTPHATMEGVDCHHAATQTWNTQPRY